MESFVDDESLDRKRLPVIRRRAAPTGPPTSVPFMSYEHQATKWLVGKASQPRASSFDALGTLGDVARRRRTHSRDHRVGTDIREVTVAHCLGAVRESCVLPLVRRERLRLDATAGLDRPGQRQCSTSVEIGHDDQGLGACRQLNRRVVATLPPTTTATVSPRLLARKSFHADRASRRALSTTIQPSTSCSTTCTERTSSASTSELPRLKRNRSVTRYRPGRPLGRAVT